MVRCSQACHVAAHKLETVVSVAVPEAGRGIYRLSPLASPWPPLSSSTSTVLHLARSVPMMQCMHNVIIHEQSDLTCTEIQR